MEPRDAAIVADRLYASLISNREIRPFFQGADISVQARKMAGALSNPRDCLEPGKSGRLIAAHMPLLDRGLTAEHFDRVTARLLETMGELELTASKQILSVVALLREALFGPEEKGARP